MKDSSEENSVEIVNFDDEIVVTVGRVEAEVRAPSEDSIIKTIWDYFCRERECKMLTTPLIINVKHHTNEANLRK